MPEEDLANTSEHIQELGRLSRDGRVVYQQESMRYKVLQWLDDTRPSPIDILSCLSGRLRLFFMQSWPTQRCRESSCVIQGVNVNTTDLCDYCSREIKNALHSRFTLFPKHETIQRQS
jgi:hypothetical protein